MTLLQTLSSPPANQTHTFPTHPTPRPGTQPNSYISQTPPRVLSRCPDTHRTRCPRTPDTRPYTYTLNQTFRPKPATRLAVYASTSNATHTHPARCTHHRHITKRTLNQHAVKRQREAHTSSPGVCRKGNSTHHGTQMGPAHARRSPLHHSDSPRQPR